MDKEDVRIVFKNNKPYGIRDKGGYLFFFADITKYSDQEERYRKEIQEQYDLADYLLKSLQSSQSEAVDTDREKDINQLCKAVLDLAPRDTGDNGTGAECPFCFGEDNWDGDVSDLKHDLDCAYLIAKDLSTNLNSG